MTAIRKSMPAASTFGEAIERFTDARIPASELLPIVPPGSDAAENARKSLGKMPGRFLSFDGEWVGLKGDHLTEGLPEDVRRRAQSWPTRNVGINGRAFPAIDADVGSELARQLVERVMVAMFGFGYAERTRGDGPRRLYALRSRVDLDLSRQVPNEKWAFRLPGDGDTLHSIDILGHGKQFVAAGTHPSGDAYEWREGYDLCAMVQADQLEWIERADIDRLQDEFEKAVREAGGTVELITGSGGAGKGTARDYSRDEPTLDPKRLIAAMRKMPNTAANFPDRENFIAVIAGFKACAGREADDFEDEVREWAARGEPGFGYEGAEFDKIWRSTRYPRVTPDFLPVLLRRHGVLDFAGDDFTDDAGNLSPGIQVHKAAEKAATRELLDRVADACVFQEMDTSTGRKFQPMRLRANPCNELDAAAWYKGRSTDQNSKLLEDLHAAFGTGEDRLFRFLRALEARHPLAFYSGTTKHPGYEPGAIVPSSNDPERPEGMLNLRRQSQARIVARKARKDPELARADVAHFRDFVRRAFGDAECTTAEGIFEEFFLDTLAYMTQTGRRPGCLFLFVGDQGVGKSILVESLIALFDGTGPGMGCRINGAKLTNENSRRFIFDGIEGCQVVPLVEMPKNARPADQIAILSELKQAVDAGPAGDWLQVEGKNRPLRWIQNHGLIIVTTNYENALEVEEQDRRTFYAPFRITLANKPNRDFYSRLVNITNDPERLAAIWEFLERRDISGYRVTDAPPTSAEKSALQIASISDAAERHLEIALRTLGHNHRWIYALEDIVQLMNEAWRRENGDDGGPEPYAAVSVGRNGISQGAWARLARHTEKRRYKSDAQVFPTLYVPKVRHGELMALTRAEAFHALKLDRRNHLLVEMARIEPYRGALDLPPLDGAAPTAGEGAATAAVATQRRTRDGSRLH